MALVKIPCMVAAMIGLQIAVTPPNPPPAANEQAPSTKWEVIVKQRSGPVVVKVICWGAAIAEAAAILANYCVSSSPMTKRILSSLVINGNPNSITTTPLFLLGAGMTTFGGWIRYQCYRALGKMFTFEMSIKEDHQLVTSGPYSHVRHPGYTGVLLTIGGMVCWHAAPGSWARECGAFSTKPGQIAVGMYLIVVTTIMTGLLARMSKEDEMLKKKFGKAWMEWAKRVPYKLIPGLY